MGNILTYMLSTVIRAYQLILSPIIRPCCRFQPTCSEYAIEALKTHGAIKGILLTSKRIGSCHPWSSKHGFDPVPTSYDRRKHAQQ